MGSIGKRLFKDESIFFLCYSFSLSLFRPSYLHIPPSYLFEQDITKKGRKKRSYRKKRARRRERDEKRARECTYTMIAKE